MRGSWMRMKNAPGLCVESRLKSSPTFIFRLGGWEKEFWAKIIKSNNYKKFLACSKTDLQKFPWLGTEIWFQKFS